MRGSPSFAGRAEAVVAEQTAQGLTTQREAFDLAKLFAEMMVIEAVIARAGQMEDASPQRFQQATGTGPPATGVCQRRLTAVPIARFEALNMPRR